MNDVLEQQILNWGISSDGRAPALHAGGTGIDTQILQLFFFNKKYTKHMAHINTNLAKNFCYKKVHSILFRKPIIVTYKKFKVFFSNM